MIDKTSPFLLRCLQGAISKTGIKLYFAIDFPFKGEIQKRGDLLRTFVCLLVILSSTSLWSQKHDYIWMSGNDHFSQPPTDSSRGTSHIDFNVYPRHIYYHYRDMDFDNTGITMCDKDGNLLFYSNGIFIADRDDNIMPGGYGMNPGWLFDEMENLGYTIPQALISIPKPGSDLEYGLFHIALDIHNNNTLIVTDRLYYSEIDMSRNNGLGEVTILNDTLVYDFLAQGYVTACKHANGRDWWIVVPKRASNCYYTGLYTPDGIDSFFLQCSGFVWDERDWNGQAVFSPDGMKYVRYGVYNDIDIYDFDRCTGILSNPRHIGLLDKADSTNAGGGLAISPNSELLYISSTWHLYQYDLTSPDMAQSKVVIASFEQGDLETGSMYRCQLTPDGDIFINRLSSFFETLHVIHQPNLLGKECSFEFQGVKLPTSYSWTLPHHPHFKLGPIDGSSCDTLGIDNVPLAGFRYDVSDLEAGFTSVSWYEPENWSWDFGDGNMSGTVDPVHIFDSSGMYDVCLTVSNQYGQDTHCKLVTVDKSTSTLYLLPDNAVIISPNPVKDYLQIQIDSRYANKVLGIEIRDIYGREAYSTLRNDIFGEQVDVSSMAPGTYVCVLRNQEGVVIWREKFVLVK